MNDAYFHSLLNHAPFFSILYGVILLVFGLLGKNISIIKTGLTLVLVATLLYLLLYLVGVGNEPPAIQFLLRQGPEWLSQWATWGFTLLAVIAVLGLLTTSSRPARARKPKVWAAVTLAVSSGALGLLLWAGLSSTSSFDLPSAKTTAPEQALTQVSE